MKGLKAFIKPFEAPQRSAKIKLNLIFISIQLSQMRGTLRVICDENDSKKIDSMNSILQHGCGVDKNCCVVFFTSRFSYLIPCPRQCKWKVATTCLAITTKNN